MDHLLSKEKGDACKSSQNIQTLIIFSFERPYNLSQWAYSSGGLERTPDKREVDGSSPFRPTIIFNYGALAQLGERLFCTQEVRGSIPLSSTIEIFEK